MLVLLLASLIVAQANAALSVAAQLSTLYFDNTYSALCNYNGPFASSALLLVVPS